MLTLTLVIPVYNEEHHIKGCLDAVAAQSVMPDEVLVVDNNCTDRTVDIAKQYHFVTVIKEKNQGRGYARSTGFSAAKSDIIGRIDADARIDRNWVEISKKYFYNDDSLDGITGVGRTSFIPGLNFIRTKLPSRAYYWYIHARFTTITMWGATMAIRATSWRLVDNKVCNDDSIVHEDQDVSLWMAAEGMKIEQKNNLIITTSGQTYRYLPKLIHYYSLYRSTKRLHTQNGNLRSKKVIKLSLLRLLPGMVAAFFVTIIHTLVSVVFFPIDYIMIHSKHRNNWLD